MRPPMRSRASSRRTFSPAVDNSREAASPEAPAPITITSALLLITQGSAHLVPRGESRHRIYTERSRCPDVDRKHLIRRGALEPALRTPDCLQEGSFRQHRQVQIQHLL